MPEPKFYTDCDPRDADDRAQLRESARRLSHDCETAGEAMWVDTACDLGDELDKVKADLAAMTADRNTWQALAEGA